MTDTAVGSWHLISDHSGFADLRDEWESLFSDNPRHSPFMAWGWVSAWLNHLAGDHRLRILVYRGHDESIELIVPLISKRQGIAKQETLNFVCGEGADCSDYLQCLRLPVHDSRLADLAATGVAKLLGNKHRITLTALDSSDRFADEFGSIMKQRGHRVRAAGTIACPRTTLPSDWDEFLKNLSSNFRWQVRRHYKRVVESDEIGFTRVAASDATEFARTLIELNRQRMGTKGEMSSLEDADFRAFIMEAIPYMANQNLAWMDLIEKDSHVLGAALNFVYGDTVYYYMGGFDQSAQKIRPGMALFAKAIQRSIKKRLCGV